MSVNAQQVKIGRERCVWLVQAERSLEMILKLVNAQSALDGTDLVVQK